MKRQRGERIAIEFPSAGATYNRPEYGVYAYGVYERSSVLAGQEKRSFLGSFATLEEARAAFPGADESGCGYREIVMPLAPPSWFDPQAAGEVWSEEDY
jgi:hypothetical protein